MDRTNAEHLPTIQSSRATTSRASTQSSIDKHQSELMVVTFSPKDISPKSSDRFSPSLFKRRATIGHNARRASEQPEVVKQMFTGQLSATYFNDICYGKRESPTEFMYRSPTKERTKALWEPKEVSRVQARHVLRDIQDARFRRKDSIDQQALKKATENRRKTVHCLMAGAQTMPRGKLAYLQQLEKERQKSIQKCQGNKKTREAMIRLEQIERHYREND